MLPNYEAYADNYDRMLVLDPDRERGSVGTRLLRLC